MTGMKKSHKTNAPDDAARSRAALDKFFRQSAEPRNPADIQKDYPVGEQLEGHQFLKHETLENIRHLAEKTRSDDPTVAADAAACLVDLAFTASAIIGRLYEVNPDLIRPTAKNYPRFPLLCAPLKKLRDHNWKIARDLPIAEALPLSSRDRNGHGRGLEIDSLSNHIRITHHEFVIIQSEAPVWSQMELKGTLVGPLAIFPRIVRLPPLTLATCPGWAGLMAEWTLDESRTIPEGSWLVKICNPARSMVRNAAKRLRRFSQTLPPVGAPTRGVCHASGKAKIDATTTANPDLRKVLAEKIQARLQKMLKPPAT
jgi:hypothetical protein